MKAQTLVPLAAAAAAQLLVVGNIAAAFAFQQKPPVETLVTVPVVAEIEQVECVRQDPVPYEPVTYQVPLDAELQSYTEKMCDLYDVPLELAYAVMQVESGFTPAAHSSTGDYGLMQINSINAGWLKDELGITDLLDARQNIQAGCYMLGTVIRAGWECATLPKKGFGQRVVVRIGSTAYYMYFGHLSKINVAVGQKLKPGDLIGVEGSTGHSTGSHLHWEIRINDISTGYVSVHQYAGIPNVAGSTAYTSNWVAELFGPSNLKKSTSGFPQRLYNSVLQGALGIDKDGIFGANTEKTVKEFQSAHGLTADGIAGAKTKAALAKQL